MRSSPMDQVSKRRMWLAAGAVVVGAAIGLTIGHLSARKVARMAVGDPVSIVLLRDNEPSPLGQAFVVKRQDEMGRLLVAASGGPERVAVFEPAAGAEVTSSMTSRLFEWIGADSTLDTVYIARPKPSPQRAP